MIWDSIGHDLASGRRWEGLRAITQVTTLYVVRYVTTHPRPPKVTGNEFGRFPSSRCKFDSNSIQITSPALRVLCLVVSVTQSFETTSVHLYSKHKQTKALDFLKG